MDYLIKITDGAYASMIEERCQILKDSDDKKDAVLDVLLRLISQLGFERLSHVCENIYYNN